MRSQMTAKIKEIGQICARRGWTLSFAESCTGGLVSAELCSEAGVSHFFKGAVVSYSGEVKAEVLEVKESLLKTHGEVSLPVALAMARGVRARLKSDWSVSVTGVAGPGGGSPSKPVGFVCFAVVGPGFEKADHKQFRAETVDAGMTARQDIQRQAALFAFDFLLNAMR